MLSCQRLIPSAFHRFLFFFFPFQDLISIPTQRFRILSSYLLSFSFLLRLLFLFLDLLHQPVSSGPSRSDGTDSKEADVTAKQLNDREEGSCVVSSSSLLSSPEVCYNRFPVPTFTQSQPSLHHFFHMWHVQTLFMCAHFSCVRGIHQSFHPSPSPFSLLHWSLRLSFTCISLSVSADLPLFSAFLFFTSGLIRI